MIFIYQLLNGHFDITLFQPATFTIIRDHSFKLCKPFANKLCCINCLKVRVVCNWNDLPQDVVNAESIDAFKNIMMSIGPILCMIICNYTLHSHFMQDTRAVPLHS